MQKNHPIARFQLGDERLHGAYFVCVCEEGGGEDFDNLSGFVNFESLFSPGRSEVLERLQQGLKLIFSDGANFFISHFVWNNV